MRFQRIDGEEIAIAAQYVRDVSGRGLVDDSGARAMELLIRRMSLSRREADFVLGEAVKAKAAGERATGKDVGDAWKRITETEPAFSQDENDRIADYRLDHISDSMRNNPESVWSANGTATLEVGGTFFQNMPSSLHTPLSGQTVVVSGPLPVRVLGYGTSGRGKARSKRYFISGDYYGIPFYGWVYEDRLSDINLPGGRAMHNPKFEDGEYSHNVLEKVHEAAKLETGDSLTTWFPSDTDNLITIKKIGRSKFLVKQTANRKDALSEGLDLLANELEYIERTGKIAESGEELYSYLRSVGVLPPRRQYNPEGDPQYWRARGYVGTILKSLDMGGLFHDSGLGGGRSLTIKKHSDGDLSAVILDARQKQVGPEVVLTVDQIGDLYHYVLHHLTTEGWKPDSQGIRNPARSDGEFYYGAGVMWLTPRRFREALSHLPDALLFDGEYARHEATEAAAGRGLAVIATSDINGERYAAVDAKEFKEIVWTEGNPYPGSGCPHTHFTGLGRKLGKPLAAWIERRKYGSGWPRRCESNLRNPVSRTKNPDDAAARLYEEFHGAPSTEVIEVEDTINYHSNLTVLGDLAELKVRLGDSPKGKGIIITFDVADGVKLCSNEDGTQLYIEGGDQTLDIDKLNLTENESSKESIILGPLQELTYRTRKRFHKFKLTDYYHQLGEETGHEPLLVYDRLNSKLLVSGGAYVIKPEGIVN